MYLNTLSFTNFIEKKAANIVRSCGTISSVQTIVTNNKAQKFNKGNHPYTGMY